MEMIRRTVAKRVSIKVPGRPRVILVVYRVRGTIPPDQIDRVRLVIRVAGQGAVISEPVESVRVGLKRGLALVASRL